jgi:hypothetical protein
MTSLNSRTTKIEEGDSHEKEDDARHEIKAGCLEVEDSREDVSEGETVNTDVIVIGK